MQTDRRPKKLAVMFLLAPQGDLRLDRRILSLPAIGRFAKLATGVNICLLGAYKNSQ